MNDKSNVVVHKRSALIIDLKMYVRDHYVQIRKALVSGDWIHDNMRQKLAHRMKHCYRITRHMARLDSATYHFSLSTTKVFGDPLCDFIPSWHACNGGKSDSKLELDYTLTLANPPTFIAVDNRLIVQ